MKLSKLKTKSIEELIDMLPEVNIEDAHRVTAVLNAKTAKFLASSVDVTREALSGKIDELNTSINSIISSGNKMFWATVVTSVAMFLLTAAIAFSALVQANIISFN